MLYTYRPAGAKDEGEDPLLHTYRPAGAKNITSPIPLIVKPIINWAHSNSLNAYNRHSDWHNLTGYATKMYIYF